MSDELNIDEILKEFQKQKEDRDKGVSPTNPNKEKTPIDFSKPAPKREPKLDGINSDPLGILSDEELVIPDKPRSEEKEQKEREKRDKKRKAEREKKERKPREKKERAPREKKEKTPKEKKSIDKKAIKRLALIVVAIVGVIAIIVGGIFGIRSASENAKSAYLKPYQEKYPDVTFPVGILEKYCEDYAKNPKAVGYITIDDIKLSTIVDTKKNEKKPYAEHCKKGSKAYNNVIYLQDDSLEKFYKDMDSYNNKASGFITYSNLFEEHSYKVVGAFYTNTNSKDDASYIFPYNCVEEQTRDSQNQFLDRLQTRFLYSTSVTITTDDQLLTISSPTDFRNGFRFVVVAVLRDNDQKLVASKKDKVHYPNAIYIENNEPNPYIFSSKWYPEIVYTDSTGQQRTLQKTIDDFR